MTSDVTMHDNERFVWQLGVAPDPTEGAKDVPEVGRKIFGSVLGQDDGRWDHTTERLEDIIIDGTAPPQLLAVAKVEITFSALLVEE